MNVSSLFSLPFEVILDTLLHPASFEICQESLMLSEDQIVRLAAINSGLIFTCRKSAGLSDSQRARFYQLAIEHGFSHVDLDAQDDSDLLRSMRHDLRKSSSKLIVSAHLLDDGINAGILRTNINKLRKLEPDILKICVNCTNSDSARLVMKTQIEHPNHSIFAMGPWGKATRIVSRIVGAPLIYISQSEDSAEVHGQLSPLEIDQLENIINTKSLDR
jgi:3-dehydroquinate dehydratase type I